MGQVPVPAPSPPAGAAGPGRPTEEHTCRRELFHIASPARTPSSSLPRSSNSWNSLWNRHTTGRSRLRVRGRSSWPPGHSPARHPSECIDESCWSSLCSGQLTEFSPIRLKLHDGIQIMCQIGAIQAAHANVLCRGDNRRSRVRGASLRLAQPWGRLSVVDRGSRRQVSMGAGLPVGRPGARHQNDAPAANRPRVADEMDLARCPRDLHNAGLTAAATFHPPESGLPTRLFGASRCNPGVV
jgi:hypothetical protein